MHIVERTATGWTVTDLKFDFTVPGDMTSQARIVGNTIALATRDDGVCAINLVRKNAQGAWSLAEQIVSDDESCFEGDFDVLGPNVAEYTGTQALISNEITYIYDLVNSVWTRTPIVLTQLPVVVGNEIALRAAPD